MQQTRARESRAALAGRYRWIKRGEGRETIQADARALTCRASVEKTDAGHFMESAGRTAINSRTNSDQYSTRLSLGNSRSSSIS